MNLSILAGSPTGNGSLMQFTRIEDLSKLRCIADKSAGGNRRFVAEPLDLKGVVSAELADEPMLAGGDEAEASVVSGFAEDDDERRAELSAGSEAGANEGRAEAAALKRRKNSDRGQAKAASYNLAADFDRGPAEENMGGDLAALHGNQRDGILAARGEQPHETGFEVGWKRRAVNGLDGDKVAGL